MYNVIHQGMLKSLFSSSQKMLSRLVIGIRRLEGKNERCDKHMVLCVQDGAINSVRDQAKRHPSVICVGQQQPE